MVYDLFNRIEDFIINQLLDFILIPVSSSDEKLVL